MAKSELATSIRTHTCGELRRASVEALAGQTVTLAGHVDARHDEATFVVRDRYGKTLVVVDPQALPHVLDRAKKLNLEDVVRVSGFVTARSAPDAALATGEVYLRGRGLEVLGEAQPLPPGVLGDAEVPYEDRLVFRQLYLRRPDVQARMGLRARVAREVREHLIGRGFLELETPHLFWYDAVATDPEPIPAGNGRAFALPSGPVVLDQYIVAGQFDRFFQLVRTTRRDTTGSPIHAQEYTGLDINLCYVDVPDLERAVEDLLAHLWQAVRGEPLPTPFPRLGYDDAMLRFGTDKPDLRFGLELADVSAAAGGEGVTRALRCPGAASSLYAADLLVIEEAGRAHGREGAGAAVSSVRIVPPRRGQTKPTFDGSAAALVEERPALLEALGAEPGDVLLFARASGPAAVAAELAGLAAGRLRLAAGRALRAIDETRPCPVWVEGYPFFELEDGRWVPRVVVFSRPAAEQDIEIAVMKPAERHRCRSLAFDLVIDGVEMASGYVGNHNQELQRLIWENLFSVETGDLFRLRAPIESHRFGVPPHGGLNLGFDRLVARLAGVAAIDEVTPFPKDHGCRDPLLDAPARVPEAAVADLVEVHPKPKYTLEDLTKEVSEA